MKYRALGLLPFGLALALGAVSLAMGPAMAGALGVANELGKMLSLAGCIAAALAFERGEYLNRAWLTYGGCYLLLLTNDTLGALSGDRLMIARGLVVLVANGCSVTGTWMLARAWSVAGLGDEGQGVTRRRLLFAGAALLALAITAIPLVHDVRDLMGGNGIALVSVASDLGDAVTLSLVAPVMQTALALRGGVLKWPWGFLTMSGLAWLVYDWTSSLMDLHTAAPGLALIGSESMRVMANGFFFAAGLAQRLAVAPDALEHLPEGT